MLPKNAFPDITSPKFNALTTEPIRQFILGNYDSKTTANVSRRRR
jgi:hypothetical protein